MLLLAGWRLIRRGRITAHKRCMLAAVATSTLFLASYLTHKAASGLHTTFPEQFPTARKVYLAILLSHTVLAAAILPLVAVTLVHAFRDDRPRHRRIARWTFPIWLYVSVTGVVIYFMLYHWYRP